MKTASSEPTQTMTVAAIQVPIPLIERPSVKSVRDDQRRRTSR